MNTTVQATGMTVTAQSNNVFLQIENSAGASVNGAKTEASAVSSSAQLFPVAIKSVTGSGAVTWGSTTSNDPTSVNYTDPASLTDVPVGNVGEFVWSDTFKVFVADNPGNVEGHNLVLSSVTATIPSGTNDMEESLRILIVGPNGAILWANDGASENSSAVASSSGIESYNTGNTILATTVPQSNSGTEYVELTVYIFFCGNDDTVKTSTVVNLANINVSLVFDVD